jgi:hypothetical protein
MTVLIPSLPQDEEALRKYKDGTVFAVDLKQPRNLAFHRKFFALLNAVYPHQDHYDNFEIFRKQVIKMCGYFEEYVDIETGEVQLLIGSISFDKMDGDTFSALYSKAVDVMLKYFIDCTHDELTDIVIGFG